MHSKIRTIFFWLFIAIALSITSCDIISELTEDAQDEVDKYIEDEIEEYLAEHYPDSITLDNNTQSLFVGTTGSETEETEVSALFQVASDGSVQEVAFLDNEGEELTISLHTLLQLSKEYLVIAGQYNSTQDAYYNDFVALASLTDGKLYDLYAYIDPYLLDENKHSLSLYNNTIYLITNSYSHSYIEEGESSVEQSTLYSIDLTSKLATPLNNAAFDPVDPYNFRFYSINESSGVVYATFNISSSPNYSWKTYASDNSTPGTTEFTSDTSSLNKSDENFLGFLGYDTSLVKSGGKQYILRINTQQTFGNDVSYGTDLDIRSFSEETSQYFNGESSLAYIHTYQLEIDGENQITISPIAELDVSFLGIVPKNIADKKVLHDSRSNSSGFTEPFGVYTSENVLSLFNAGGRIDLTKENGNLSVAAYSVDYSALENAKFYNGHLYYRNKESKFLERIPYEGGAAETIIENNDIIDWYITGNLIIYTAYITATDINTYSIPPQAGAKATLLNEDSIEVSNIVELTL